MLVAKPTEAADDAKYCARGNNKNTKEKSREGLAEATAVTETKTNAATPATPTAAGSPRYVAFAAAAAATAAVVAAAGTAGQTFQDARV
jgi:hypothetical protein